MEKRQQLKKQSDIFKFMREKLRVSAGKRLDSLGLLRYWPVRWVVDHAIRGIEIEPMPLSLGEEKRAILISNYPSVSQTLRAVMKVGCRLPGREGLRIGGISRQEVVEKANPSLRVLGATKFLSPAAKDQAGAYRLEPKTTKRILRHLDEPGGVLWLSITGRTGDNGLLERDLRTGAAMFAERKQVPMVPMGLITKENEKGMRISGVRFGEPITPPETSGLDDSGRADCWLDHVSLAASMIAELLPPGQRGDFEDAEERLKEIRSRLA